MNNEYTYYCEKCKYGTNIKISYDTHCESKKHINGKTNRKIKENKVNYVCDKCNFQSSNINNYLVHNLNNHSTKDERKNKFKYYCDICDFGVFTLSLFEKHTNSSRHMRLQTNIK